MDFDLKKIKESDQHIHLLVFGYIKKQQTELFGDNDGNNITDLIIYIIMAFYADSGYFRSLFIFDCMVSGSDLDDKIDLRPSSVKAPKGLSWYSSGSTGEAENGNKRPGLNRVCDCFCQLLVYLTYIV